MEHRKSENRTQQQKQQPTTVTILMLICRVDTHPNQGFWTKLRPRGLSTRFFVVEKPGTRPLRLRNGEKAGGQATWPQLGPKALIWMCIHPTYHHQMFY